MTPAEIAALRARCEAATPGPWYWNSYSMVQSSPMTVAEQALENRILAENDGDPAALDDPRYKTEWYQAESAVCFVPASHGDTATGRHAADAAFIAEARTDIPALLGALAASQAQVAAAARVVAAARVIAEHEGSCVNYPELLDALAALDTAEKLDDSAEEDREDHPRS